MRRKVAIPIALGAVVAPVAVGVALATPPTGLTSQLLARGAAGEFRFVDRSTGLRMQAGRPTDLAIVRATLAPGGDTGWHGHHAHSLVIVKSGVITMKEPTGHHHGHHGAGWEQGGERRRPPGCTTRQISPGQAFVHPPSVHNFVNEGSEEAEFYVAYFVPAGATPLLRDEPVPAGCS